MTIANLKKVLDYANSENIGIIGFVVHGWEDARAFVHAGETIKVPIILQAGPGSRDHTPLSVLGKMFRVLASESEQDVVLHLDHAKELRTCQNALDEGFTSIMFDGSQLELSENIKMTQKVCKLVQPYNASVEAEIGYVGYSEIDKNRETKATDIKKFLPEVEIDALAISVGNTHLQEKTDATINYSKLSQINKITNVPLVVHGASGISPKNRKKMLKCFGVKKFNIGTEVRKQFGQTLRYELHVNINNYDRLKLLSAVENDLKFKAISLLKEISQ